MSRVSARVALVAAVVVALVGAAIGIALPATAAAACASAWSASATYVGGDTASQSGVNYRANWWTRGDAPSSHNGSIGTGQPWTVVGACGTTPAPSPSPTSSPSPTGGVDGCVAAWSAAAVYVGGQSASRNGVNYRANWWTRGDDPATRSGGSGTGAPWTVVGACGGSATPAPTPTPTPSPTASPTPTPTSSPSVSPTPSPSPSSGTGAASGFVFSPYKDVTMGMNWNTYAMNTAVTGTLAPLTGANGLFTSTLPSLHALTLAFATGTCGAENWGGVPGQVFRDGNIPALDAANVDYIVSTGGAAGAFTCASTAGMRSFIDRYASDNLIGVDFDIEAGQSSADIQNLVAAVKGVQSAYPKLRFSFTLATLAASSGGGGVNATGDAVVRAVLAAGITNYTINLMAMDYGDAGPYICVVSGGVCDMGQSAIQAVKNLQRTYAIPASHIELTPMIGLNDNPTETFSLQDVDTMTAYVKANGLLVIHFWSLDRDIPCAGSSQWVSTTCNSVPTGTAPLSYTKRFLAAIG